MSCSSKQRNNFERERIERYVSVGRSVEWDSNRGDITLQKTRTLFHVSQSDGNAHAAREEINSFLLFFVSLAAWEGEKSRSLAASCNVASSCLH